MAIKAPLILSLNVGLSKAFGKEGAADPMDQPWRSAIFKDPVEGPVWLSTKGLNGDAVTEVDHGGSDQAVLGYGADHYTAWRTELSLPNLKHGAFGENFTLSRQNEDSVCVGDIYSVGEARLQVTMPRNPCWKLNRRFRLPDIVERVHAQVRGGWYLRVLAEGFVERGNFMVLDDRPHPEWTVVRAYRAYHGRVQDRESAAALAACPSLSSSWREKLREE